MGDSCCLLCPRVHISRKLGWRVQQGLKPRPPKQRKEAMKMPVGMLFGILGKAATGVQPDLTLECWFPTGLLCFQSSLLLTRLGEHWKMTQRLDPLWPTRKTRKQVWDPGSGLVRPWLFGGVSQQRADHSFSFSLFHFVVQINLNKYVLANKMFLSVKPTSFDSTG